MASAPTDPDEAFDMARDLFDDWQAENRGWNPHSNRTLKEWMEKARGNFIMHWKESQKYTKILLGLAIPTLVLGAFVGVAGLESAFLADGLSTTERVIRGVSAFLTMTVASLANVLAFLDPKSKEAAFRDASNSFSDISARLRFEYDRDWNHRTPHAILMRSVMAQMSEIKKNTPSLSETSIRSYQQAFGSKGDTTYLPDIMVPIGKMGEDAHPSYSWVAGRPRRSSAGDDSAKAPTASSLLRLAAMRWAASEHKGAEEPREPPVINGDKSQAEKGTNDPHSDEDTYDPHNDEEHGRQTAPGIPADLMEDPTRNFQKSQTDAVLFF